jgi:mono/diheme cytochrome c family protein
MTSNAALLYLAVCVAIASAAGQQQRKARNDEPLQVVLARVPAKVRVVLNPFENDAEALPAGKKLFQQHCAECHGETATGSNRGPDLRAANLQQATPGEIFWILTNGVVRRGMPSWSKLPDPQRWQLVTYLRTLVDSPVR